MKDKKIENEEKVSFISEMKDKNKKLIIFKVISLLNFDFVRIVSYVTEQIRHY